MTGRSHDSEPQRYTGYLLRRAQQLHAAAWARIVSAETSSVQYSIIVTLARLGEASQRELCDEVDLDRSTIADLLKRMERRGLLTRRRAADDARRNTVTLSERGRAEHQRLRPLAERVEQELTDALPAADRSELRRLLLLLLAG